MLTETLLLIATLAAALVIWQKRVHSYWKRQGIPYIEPLPIIGNLKSFLSGKVAFHEQLSLWHQTPGMEKAPVIGVYVLKGPAMIVRDLELVKAVMIKKFNYFVNRVLRTDPHYDPLGYNNLFFVRKEWKTLRNKLSPIFSSGKIKQMYPLMVDVSIACKWDHSTSLNSFDLYRLAAIFTHTCRRGHKVPWLRLKIFVHVLPPIL